MAVMPPPRKGIPVSFRGGHPKPVKAVKPPTAQPPGPGPMAGNRSPMMHSNVTMGGKTPNMMPPARNTSMMAPSQPNASRMFADGGGISDPEPIGGMPDMPPAAGDAPPAAGGPPAPVGGPTTVVITPESVNYHDDEQACHLCSYMGDDGICAVLQIQVSPPGSCNAFKAGPQEGTEGAGPEGSAQGDEGPDNGEAPSDTPMGTSASGPQG